MGQYKSKRAFGDISSSKQYINAKVITDFSSSGHGKGKVDAAAGFLKSAARRAIIRNLHLKIRDAQELYDFAVQH